MEMDSQISMSTYHRRYGHLKLIDFSFHSTDSHSFLQISDSSSNAIFPPLPRYPNLTAKISPATLHLRRCSKNIKKRNFTPKKKSTCSSIKGSFEAAGGVRKCSSSWVKSRLLGKGGYGSVYLATRKNERVRIERAIKSAKLSRASTLMDEGRILRRLQSPFVVRCYGDETVREGTDHLYNLILEYCTGQCLADMIEDHPGGLSESDVKIFVRDVMSGLRDIHDRNIIHCDIKPDNLLLCHVDHRTRPNGYLTKIGDFGLAMEKGSVEYRNGCGHMRGTTRYMAPELIGRGIVDFSVDTWSLGCSILEMLTGKSVWAEHGDLCFEEWVHLIGQSDLIPHIPSWLSADAQDFLKRCFVKDSARRWGIPALEYHPFVYSDEDFSDNGFVYD